jgi:predicted esterase
LPASFNVGLHQFNWTETGAGISHVGPTGLALPGRVLATEVRYPTLAGSPSAEASDAPPSKVGAPYPVIVFAHGFDTDPTDYAGLLDAWVRAGFVVVSPIFPDESSEAVTAVGGLGTSAAATLENDVYNEPGDIVYVLKQLQSVAGDPWGSNLTGVMNLSDVGLAGQSDGANVVAALSYASGLSKTYSELASPPKAVAVLSGLAWTTSSTGTYGGSATSPALLQVQSDADGCVSPALASYLYAKLQTGLSSKWFVTLLGADHLAPYEGVSPWAPVVNAVTTKFFERELKWRSSSASAASVQAAGTVTGAAQITTTVSDATIPQAPLIPGC